MSDSQSESPELINRVLQRDEDALAELFSMYRPRLWRMVSFRLHPQLQGRVDTDDILQEAWLNAAQLIDHFLQDASRSIFVWFRLIVSQTLVDIHRRHLRAQKRSTAREISTSGVWRSDSTSFALSFQLLGHLTSPSQAALRAELSEQLDAALSSLSEMDREVLALRHFEELTNAETAQVLNMTEQAASMRYTRALTRLKHVLQAIPDFPRE